MTINFIFNIVFTVTMQVSLKDLFSKLWNEIESNQYSRYFIKILVQTAAHAWVIHSDITFPSCQILLASCTVFDMQSRFPNLCRTKYIKKKSIPVIALWCPAVSNHGWLYHAWNTQQPIIVIILIIYSPYLSKDLIEL